MSRRSWALIFLAALIGVAILLACGTSSNSSKLATTTVTLSDPATCSAPNGPYDHIYVTVMDVQVNTNPAAGDNDSGWQTVIPDMKGKPQQVDLLGAANNECFLKQLGSTTQLQPGSYQMIRVILADNSTKPSPNACGGETGPSNCVFLHDNPTPQPLLLSSETQTGIKIPSGQIAGGKFVVEAGQQKDLDIDFNACASIVVQGNGGVRLKPVLHAGEVGLSSSISGQVVDQATQQPIPDADVVVALEYDNNGVESVKMQTMADQNGNFNFCPVSPLASGAYNVVVVAIKKDQTVAYAATITTGVTPGAIMGKIPVNAAGVPTTIQGQVTAQNASQAGTIADVSLSALQQVTANTGDVKFIIPLALQAAVTVPLSIDGTQGCPAGTNCKSYSMVIPGAKPYVGAFTQTNPSWAQAASSDYFINAQATVPGHSDQTDCAQPSQTVGPVVITGPSVTAPVIQFTGCQ